MPDEVADRLCPNCGATNYRTAPFCYACGQPTPKHGRSLGPSRYDALDWEAPTGFSTSWSLTSGTLRLVRDHPSLLLYPLGGVAGAAILGFLAIWALWLTISGGLFWPLDLVMAFAAYLGLCFLATLGQAGLVRSAARRLRDGSTKTVGAGENPGVTVAALAGWSAWVATFGPVLASLQRRRMWLGGSAEGLGVFNSTYFVVPAILFEGWGPLEALDRSGRLAAEGFGDRLVINAAGDVMVAVGAIAMTVLLLLWLSHPPSLAPDLSGWGLAIGAIVVGAATAVLGLTLDAVLKADMYLHLTSGNVSTVTPRGFLPSG